MGTGIILCGLNGVGKSTLGRALAEKLNIRFIDNEDLYFPKTDDRYIYASPRTRDEVEKLLLREIQEHEDFVFASVKGDYGEEVCLAFDHAVLVSAPREIRLERVKNRSFQKFGDEMLPGGRLYEQEEKFFEFVRARDEMTVETWIQSMDCPVIRVDGTRPVEDNIRLILEKLSDQQAGET